MGNNRIMTEKEAAGGKNRTVLAAVGAAALWAAFQMAAAAEMGLEGGAWYASPCLACGMLFLLSAFALPDGVSGRMERQIRKGRKDAAADFFLASLILAAAGGGILAAALWFGAEALAAVFGPAEGAFLWRALAPAAWMMMIQGAARGGFCGRKMGTFAGISLLLEAAAGGIAAWLWTADGVREAVRSSLVYGTDPSGGLFAAEGAVRGFSAGTAVSLAFLLLAVFARRRKLFCGGRKKSPVLLTGSALRALVPGVLTVISWGAVLLWEGFLYGKTDAAGWGEFVRCELAVCLLAAAACSGGVYSAAALARGKRDRRGRLAGAVRLAAIPAAAGAVLLAVFGNPLHRIFFGGESLRTGLPAACAVSVILLSLAAVLTASLFSLGKRGLAAAFSVTAAAVGAAAAGICQMAGLGNFGPAAAQAAGLLWLCLSEGAALSLMTRPAKIPSAPETEVRGRSRRRR